MAFLDLFRRQKGQRATTCPVCGRAYGPEVRFCPRDGATLDKKATRYSAFISYRRQSGSHAARVVRMMVEELSDKKLFLDVDELGTGRFDERLLGIIENTSALIVILSPKSLERCGDSGDWLTREITHAFDRKKNIIPVMVDGFTFPDPTILASLPAAVAALPNYQAVIFEHHYAEASARRILAYMTEPLRAHSGEAGVSVSPRQNPDAVAPSNDTLPPPPPRPEIIGRPTRGWFRKRWLWAGTATVVAASVILGWRFCRPEILARRLADAPPAATVVRHESEEGTRGALSPKKAIPPGGPLPQDTDGLLSNEPGVRFTGPGDPIAAAFSPDGRQLVALFTGTTGNRGTLPVVRVWDLETRQQVTECVLSSYVERAGDFSPDRQRVLVAYYSPGGGHGVGVIDIPTCTKVQQLESIWARSLKFSSDGKDAFLEGRREEFGPNDQIEVWDLERAKVKYKRGFKGLRAWHSTLAVDPRGQWVAFLGGDGTSGRSAPEDPAISAWDSRLGRELWHVDEGFSVTSRGLGVSPDGRVLLVGRRNKVDLFRMPEGEQTGTLECPQGEMYGIAFSSDARLVLAGGTGLALCLWDFPSRRLLASSKGTKWMSASDVAFSPKGNRFLVVGDSVYVYPTPK